MGDVPAINEEFLININLCSPMLHLGLQTVVCFGYGRNGKPQSLGKLF